MKIEKLNDAIRNIDDMFITEAASVTVQSHRMKPEVFWLKAASIAACFVAVVLCMSTLLPNNNDVHTNPPIEHPSIGNPVKDSPVKDNLGDENQGEQYVGYDDETLEEIIRVDFDNIDYWVIGRNHMDHSDAKNLPAEITDDMVGEYLGEGIIRHGVDQPEIKVPVYACTVSDGEYLRIVNYNGQYLYMQYSCFTDDTILTPRKLAEMLGVNDSSEITKITVKNRNERETKEISDSSIIGKFWNAFLDAECIDQNEFEYRIFGDMSEEERQEIEELGGERALVSNSYIATLFLQNDIQYEMLSDEFEGVHYSCFISYYVVMPDEYSYLLAKAMQ